MTTLEVPPYAVTSGNGSPVIVGGGDLLGDHSDATYVDLTTLYAKPFDSGWYRIDRVDCPVVATFPDGATNIAFEKVFVRASATDPASAPGGTRLSVEVANSDFTEDFTFDTGAGTVIPSDGLVHEFDLTYYSTFGSGSVPELLTGGDATLYLSVFTPSGGTDDPDGVWTNTARVFEAIFYFTYDLGVQRVRKVPIGPLRRVPAEKWQGLGPRRGGGYN